MYIFELLLFTRSLVYDFLWKKKKLKRLYLEFVERAEGWTYPSCQWGYSR